MSTNRPATNKHDVRIAWIKYSARVLYGVIALTAGIIARNLLG